MDFRKAPKIELHLHLDCSLSYEVVQQINPEITLKDYQDNFVGPPKCHDLADFLTRAVNGVQLMQSKENLELVTLDLFQQLQEDGVIYAEIRFAPLLHLEGGLAPEEVVSIVEEACNQGVAQSGVEAKLILCTLRHFSEQQSLETVNLVKQFQGSRVVGFDIAADEAGFPIDNHLKAFAFAKTNGIPCTAHAGEAKGPKSVWETLKQFQVQRIGHGARSVEDPLLLDHLQERQIHLELCPTSNVQTNIVDTLADHPADLIYRHGISMSINTDARTIANINLREEYQHLQNHFDWKASHFFRCNLEAIAHAFCDESTKIKLRKSLIDFYAASSALRIRPYEDKDLKALVNLVMTIQNGEFFLGLQPESQKDLVDIPNFFKEGGFWIVEVGETLVACIGLQALDQEYAVLRKMFIKKAFRGKPLNIAQLLYQTLEDYAQKKGFSKILLDTPGVAKAAHRFYERNAFQQIPKTEIPSNYFFIDVQSKVYLKNLR